MPAHDDQPTLRLYTLRRLLAHHAPMAVFTMETPASAIIQVAGGRPGVAIVLVDQAGVFQGTLSAAALGRALAAPDAPAHTFMSTRIVMVEPESDPRAAALAIAAADADAALVVDARGQLLGVVSPQDLAA